MTGAILVVGSIIGLISLIHAGIYLHAFLNNNLYEGSHWFWPIRVSIVLVISVRSIIRGISNLILRIKKTKENIRNIDNIKILKKTFEDDSYCYIAQKLILDDKKFVWKTFHKSMDVWYKWREWHCHESRIKDEVGFDSAEEAQEAVYNYETDQLKIELAKEKMESHATTEIMGTYKLKLIENTED